MRDREAHGRGLFSKEVGAIVHKMHKSDLSHHTYEAELGDIPSTGCFTKLKLDISCVVLSFQYSLGSEHWYHQCFVNKCINTNVLVRTKALGSDSSKILMPGLVIIWCKVK